MQNIERSIIENMDYSDEVKTLQQKLADIDKQIQEARQGAIWSARSLIQQYNIKPEELKDEEPETQQNEESPV